VEASELINLPGLAIDITRPGSASENTIYANLAFAASSPGLEKWLSRITFTRGTLLSKIHLIGIKSVSPSHSTFKPRLRILNYPDLICWAGQTFNNQAHSLEYLFCLVIALLSPASREGCMLT
jgi:hypothetical protein